MTSPGVHISFFDAGEPPDRELPAIGPLEGVLLRGDRVVIEHADVAVPDEPGVAVTRWFEGVVELQRATGETPGGRHRASMRISAPDGLYLRFGAVGEPGAALPELGPFARVLVGARLIEANGEVLASRASRHDGMWMLTARAGLTAVGAERPDVGFRSTSRPYHAWMTERLPAATAPAEVGPRPTPFVPPPVSPAPPAPSPSQRALKDSEQDLSERRGRLEDEERARAEQKARQLDAAMAEAGARAAAARAAAEARELALRQATADAATARDAAARGLTGRFAPTTQTPATSRGTASSGPVASSRQPTATRETTTSSRHISRAPATTAARTEPREAEGGNDWLELLWRFRLALLGLLIAVLGLYGFFALQPRSASQPQERIYSLGQKISGVRWDYVVNGIQREPLAGTTRARGIYVVVRVTVTNKGTGNTQAFPEDFALIDATGARHGPETLQSGVYTAPDNRSPFDWPDTYPPGRAVTARVVFDVDAGLKGLQLAITELPGTKVKLE